MEDIMIHEVVQLHLEHPFVKRALVRFTAQGYGAHDLHRATIVRDDRALRGQPRARGRRGSLEFVWSRRVPPS